MSEQAYMGKFLRDYESPLLSLNVALNYFLTSPASPSAIITQEIEFPDVSFYQEEIEYAIMSQKTKAIILRIGQGSWVDSQFERNYREAKKHGLLVGGYWFYDGRTSPGEQANLLASLLAGKKLELEVYADWERNYGGAHEGLGNVVAMMQVVEGKNLNIKGVGLYTGYYFFRANSNPIANASHYNYLKNKNLWLAWYTGNPANVLIPSPWSKLHFWQWGTPVLDWGQATKEIDMNWFNGTKAEFENLYGVNPPEEPGEPIMDYMKLTPDESNEWRSVREQTSYPNVPHIFGSKKGQINVGSFAKANPDDKYTYTNNVTYVIGTTRYEAFSGDVWWKVYEVNGVPMQGWVAEIHKGERYLNTNLVPGTPGEPVPPTLPTLNVRLSDDEGNYPTIDIQWKPNDPST